MELLTGLAEWHSLATRLAFLRRNKLDPPPEAGFLLPEI